jgi:hypothetical protein
VVDQREAAADFTVVAGLLRPEEGADAGVGPGEALPFQVGYHPGEFVHQETHLLRGDLVVFHVFRPQ